ncbi:N-acetylmuramoyl-L-alanine amidase [compost metagenome]
MKQQGNFLLLERNELQAWIAQKEVTRKIDRLQVHHTWVPNYSTRKGQDHFKCLEGMRTSHLKNGWAATGQHFTTFEDGKVGISIDRDLNRTPAGIKGANSRAVCIEHVGNFDTNGDTLSDEQKKTIVFLYALLSDKFNLPVDTEHIVYHHWYSADGTQIVDLKTGKSISSKLPSKTCPGTNFFGDGNTVAAANKTLIPMIKAELNNLKIKVEDEPMTPAEKKDYDELKSAVAKLTESKDLLKQSILEQGATILAQEEKINRLEASSKMDTPDYAKEAVSVLSTLKDAKGNLVVNTPTGRSKDFYDIVTVLYRAGVIKK